MPPIHCTQKNNSKGYQGKRIDNTSVRDEPYEFTLGAGDAIGAFEEAVAGMRVGGIRRVEVPGDRPALGYALDRCALSPCLLLACSLACMLAAPSLFPRRADIQDHARQQTTHQTT